MISMETGLIITLVLLLLALAYNGVAAYIITQNLIALNLYKKSVFREVVDQKVAETVIDEGLYF